MFLFLFLVAVVATASTAALNGTTYEDYHLSSQDFEFLLNLPKQRSATRLPGFHYLYVELGNRVTSFLNTTHRQIEVAASPRTSQNALAVAAGIVGKMTMHMEPNTFHFLTHGTVGVFTAAEKLTIFPEMASLSNGNCGASCAGSCSHTCTFDGRKYENIGGLTNSRAVVLDDIVLCSANDPYHHITNILVHEFGHLVHTFATTPAIKTQIQQAYNAAKQHATWQLNTYATANEFEYWAMATATFFGVTHEGNSNTGGMNQCGAALCSSVPMAKENLRTRDPALFNLLTQVYLNNDPSFNPRIPICPTGSPLIG